MGGLLRKPGNISNPLVQYLLDTFWDVPSMNDRDEVDKMDRMSPSNVENQQGRDDVTQVGLTDGECLVSMYLP